MAMALRPLAPGDWIQPDEKLEAELAEKDRLLAERRNDVIATLPGSEAAQAELLAVLSAHLPARFPGIYRLAAGRMQIGGGRSVELRGPCAIETAGCLAQEDFCILRSPGAGEPYCLTAASLCFPARWRLADKMGKPMAAIHGPVPLYADRMARQVDRFFQHLKAEKPVWRINWSLLDDPALFQPTGHGRTAEDPRFHPDTIGRTVWFRSERQTLVRLPESEAIVFGIRTYQVPLEDVANDPVRAGRMLEAIRTMAPEMYAYKSFAVFRQPLERYLERQSADSAAAKAHS